MDPVDATLGRASGSTDRVDDGIERVTDDAVDAVDTRIEDGPAELDLTDPDVLAAVAATLSDDPEQFDGWLSKLRSGSPF